jgi:t-SNARE complex subunit (syntaxin)
MGKAAKAHRKKVAKRNANMKQQEKKMQKLWQEAFEEQMNVMKEKFANYSADTGNTETVTTTDKIDDINLKLKEIENSIQNLEKEEELENLNKNLLGLKNMFEKNTSDEENIQEETTQEQSEPTEPIQGE